MMRFRIIYLLPTGAILVLIGFLLSPDFIVNYLLVDYHLSREALQSIAFMRISMVCIGALFLILAVLLILYPSCLKGFLARVSNISGKLQTPYYYITFLFACFCMALTLGFLLTESGSNLHVDSFKYMSIAETIHDEKSFTVLFDNYEIGPLYPLLIAAMMFLGFAVEVAAQWISIFSFALLLIPLFLLGKRLGGFFISYLICIVSLIFTPMLLMASSPMTDMLFTTISAYAILFMYIFAMSHKPKTKTLCIIGCLVLLAILARPVGLSLSIVALLVIVLKNRSQLKKTVYQVLLFSSIICLPMIPCIWLGRVQIQGMFNSLVVASGIGFLGNVGRALQMIVNDFLLLHPTRSYNSYIFVAIMLSFIILLAIYLVIRLHKSTGFRKYLFNNHLIVIFVFVYIVFMCIFTSMIYDFGIRNRYLWPIYPFILLLALSFFSFVWTQTSQNLRRITILSVISIFCLMIFPLHIGETVAYGESATDGLGFNGVYWKNNRGIAWINNNVHENDVIYTTFIPLVVEHYANRTVNSFPSLDNYDTWVDEFKGSGKNGQCYIMEFPPVISSNCQTLLSECIDISEINQEYSFFGIVVEFDDSTIWRVQYDL